MQSASRQLFELADAEYSEEERIAARAEEDVPEGIPPSPQSRVIPTEPVNPPPAPVYNCECGCIDWYTPLKNGGKTIYNYTDGTEYTQCTDIGKGLPCGDKLNLEMITIEEARENCPYYDWNDPNTKMPTDLIVYLTKWNPISSYDSRFDIHHPDHYLNHYQSLQDLITHLEKTNWCETNWLDPDPLQGTTNEAQAKQEIAEIEALKQTSLDS